MNINVQQNKNAVTEALKNMDLTPEQLNKALTLYKNKKDTDFIQDLNYGLNSSYAESFPYFVTQDGQPIDFNKELTLEEGLNLIAFYIKTKYCRDDIEYNNPKLSSLIQQFYDSKDQNGGNPNYLELFNYINVLFKKDNLNMLSNDVNNDDIAKISPIIQSSEIPKYLGAFGDQTINEVLHKLNNLIIKLPSINMDLHISPLTLITTGLVYRSLLKQFNNRYVKAELPCGLSMEMVEKIRLMRLNHFKFFALIAAPSSSIAVLSTQTSRLLGGPNIIELKFSAENKLISGAKEVQNVGIQHIQQSFAPLIVWFRKKIIQNRLVKWFFF